MAEPVLMMSETANTDLVDVSPDCREQICCDSLLPALAQEQVWLAGYSRLKTRYRIERRLADVHCFLLTLGGEGEVRLQIAEPATSPRNPRYPSTVPNPDEPLQILVNNLDHDDYVGRLGIGRIAAGTIRANQQVGILKDGRNVKATIKVLTTFEGFLATVGDWVERAILLMACAAMAGLTAGFALGVAMLLGKGR